MLKIDRWCIFCFHENKIHFLRCFCWGGRKGCCWILGAEFFDSFGYGLGGFSQIILPKVYIRTIGVCFISVQLSHYCEVCIKDKHPLVVLWGRGGSSETWRRLYIWCKFIEIIHLLFYSVSLSYIHCFIEMVLQRCKLFKLNSQNEVTCHNSNLNQSKSVQVTDFTFV